MGFLKYIQMAGVLGAVSIIALLWLQNKGHISARNKQAATIAKQEGTIEQHKKLITQFEAVKTADDKTIKLLETQLRDQVYIDERFAALDKNILRGLEASKRAIISSIPEPALAPECRIPSSVPVDTMCAVRREAGLPTGDLTCPALS